MLASGYSMVQEESTVIESCEQVSTSRRFVDRCEPPPRRKSSIFSNYSDTSESSTHDISDTSIQGKKVEEFLGTSFDENLKKLRRHKDIYGIFQDV